MVSMESECRPSVDTTRGELGNMKCLEAVNGCARTKLRFSALASFKLMAALDDVLHPKTVTKARYVSGLITSTNIPEQATCNLD